ncbi:MAG: glycosyltransferase family 2 protein [Elusimicrobia bacterium]|nr:glycosyltransferase family 2 protein [Elusimicrobiota bacterium]
MPRFSVVIPVRNEAAAIVALCESVQRVLRGLSAPFEIVVADDGSDDGTLDRLRTLAGTAPLRVVILEGRQGQAAALQAGFESSRGPILVTLDGDGQNDPEDVPRLLSRLDEGYDVVCGWRRDRRDPPAKRLASRLANAARVLLTGDTVHDVGCTLRVLRREAWRPIYLSGGLHRYFVALAARYGSRIAEVEVRHHPRRSGASKYGLLDRLLQGSADLLKVLRLDPARPMARVPEYRVREVLDL